MLFIYRHDVIFIFRFDECVEGGESILLDAYPVVEEMRRKHPKQFDTLTKIPAIFEKIRFEGFVNLQTYIDFIS